MELRSSEDEVASLYDRFHWIKRQLGLVGLQLPVPADDEALESSSPNAAEKDTETQPECSAKELKIAMEDYRRRIEKLAPLIDRFRKRLNDKDPVTDKPRYGTQTKQRVEQLLSKFAKIAAVEIDPALVQDLALEETKNAEEEQKRKKQAELDAIAAKEALDQERKRQAEVERLEAERKIQAERAAEIERIQREVREAAEAERAWVRSIPRTPDSVRANVRRFRNTEGSMKALKTIFSQILSHPEDDSCRRIRRDHPQFLADIGNYDGGKEVLIAGGFDLGLVDEVPSFICREPNVETDLDGWTAWYDRIKGALQIITEEETNAES